MPQNKIRCALIITFVWFNIDLIINVMIVKREIK